MTNSLLWFQAHLCLLIINDLLASLVNYTPHQDFEIQKTKIFESFLSSSRANDKAKILSPPWKIENLEPDSVLRCSTTEPQTLYYLLDH